MNESVLKNLVEASLLAAGRPMTIAQLAELFEERERPSPNEMRAALEALHADFENRGIELREVASGWRIQVRSQCMDVVSRLWQERPSRYSRALLETLALIAYRQPITRSEIEEIRGVAISSTIMRTLQERNWIRVLGHREVPGRPELLGTTREFLDYFGLRSLDQLPSLAELKDMDSVGVQLELPGGDTLPEASATDEAGAGEAAEGAAGELRSTAEGAAAAKEVDAAAALTDLDAVAEQDSEDDSTDADSEDDSDEDGERRSPTLVAGADYAERIEHERRDPSERE